MRCRPFVGKAMKACLVQGPFSNREKDRMGDPLVYSAICPPLCRAAHDADLLVADLLAQRIAVEA